MRWGGTVSVALHAGLVAGLAVLARPGRVPPPRRLEPLNIRVVRAPAAPATEPTGAAAGVATATGAEPRGRRSPAAPAPVETSGAPPPVAAPATEAAPAPVVPPPAAVARDVVAIGPPSSPALDLAPRPPPPEPPGSAPKPSIQVFTPERFAHTVKRELVEWMKDPYAYRRRLAGADGKTPGRWMLKPTAPLAQPTDPDPGAKELMIYVPLVTGTFDGP
ncbi:MAG TPA: hypothetical protein VKE22_26185 [Haliangiales bacterium]|nr:hypothetical protein [Haliangiales bacterium]